MIKTLAKFQDKKIAHRDIKPANVFLYNDNKENLRGILGDLGILTARLNDDVSCPVAGLVPMGVPSKEESLSLASTIVMASEA